MKKFIIDGNNLIGKDRKLKTIQKKDPQESRFQLAFKLDRYFSDKKYKVNLHFDGHQKDPIGTSKVRITYSDNRTADEVIRDQIESANNPKNLIVVTSDRSLFEFAKVCRCEIQSSEAFLNQIEKESETKSEEEITKSISDDEIKRLFDV